MATRLLVKDIERQLGEINKLRGYQNSYSIMVEGEPVANIGAWVHGGAYGMHRVEEIVSDGYGIKAVTGYGTLRETSTFLQGVLNGLYQCKEVAK